MKLIKKIDEYFPLFIRVSIALLLLVGHGIPKMSLLLFDYPLWGPHQDPIPLTFGKILAATIEFFGPLMMITGVWHRIGAGLIGFLMLLAALPLPFYHIRLTDIPAGYPVAIVPSKELQFYIAMVFFSTIFLSRKTS